MSKKSGGRTGMMSTDVVVTAFEDIGAVFRNGSLYMNKRAVRIPDYKEIDGPMVARLARTLLVSKEQLNLGGGSR